MGTAVFWYSTTEIIKANLEHRQLNDFQKIGLGYKLKPYLDQIGQENKISKQNESLGGKGVKCLAPLERENEEIGILHLDYAKNNYEKNDLSELDRWILLFLFSYLKNLLKHLLSSLLEISLPPWCLTQSKKCLRSLWLWLWLLLSLWLLLLSWCPSLVASAGVATPLAAIIEAVATTIANVVKSFVFVIITVCLKESVKVLRNYIN